MALKVRILPFLTTFAQLSARLKNFLGDWLLVLGIKKGLVECATVCDKSVVILNVVAVLKKFILKANYLPKIRTGDFSLLLKYLSLYPIKPQINLYVWTALSAIANVI